MHILSVVLISANTGLIPINNTIIVTAVNGEIKQCMYGNWGSTIIKSNNITSLKYNTHGLTVYEARIYYTTSGSVEPPTEEPTESPTEDPTEPPTEEPTEPPTEVPTEAPTQPEETNLTISVNGNSSVDVGNKIYFNLNAASNIKFKDINNGTSGLYVDNNEKSVRGDTAGKYTVWNEDSNGNKSNEVEITIKPTISVNGNSTIKVDEQASFNLNPDAEIQYSPDNENGLKVDNNNNKVTAAKAGTYKVWIEYNGAKSNEVDLIVQSKETTTSSSTPSAEQTTVATGTYPPSSYTTCVVTDPAKLGTISGDKKGFKLSDYLPPGAILKKVSINIHMVKAMIIIRY